MLELEQYDEHSNKNIFTKSGSPTKQIKGCGPTHWSDSIKDK